jgi:diguanylate cyclase (GGDEF)-like protein/PAS domain S-box-containing protein
MGGVLASAMSHAIEFEDKQRALADRTLALAALRQSEEEYRATFEMAGVGKAQLDLRTGKFVRVNGKLCEMLGYTSDELCDLNAEQLVHPQDFAVSQEGRRQLVAGEIAEYAREARYLRKDGGIIWVSVNAVLIHDAQKRPMRGVFTIIDITERKRAQWLEEDRRRVLEMVACDMPLPEVLGNLALAVERQLGGIAGILVLQDGDVALRGPSIPGPWANSLRAHCLKLAAQLSARAWSAGEHACGVTDLAADPAWAQLAPLAAEFNLLACWTLPIQSVDSGALGVLCVFRPDHEPPRESDVQTLEMAARLAAICIDHHNTTRQLAHLVRHDPLTGLPNRIMFEDRVQQALAVARRTGRSVAVMVLDIDKFKSFNDTLGHHAGDHLLQQFANRMRTRLRQSDTMARVGGDEFVMVLPDIDDARGASALARKLVDALKEPFEIADQPANVTTSIGIALFPGDADDAVTLQKKADAALYRAKQHGRNGYSF